MNRPLIIVFLLSPMIAYGVPDLTVGSSFHAFDHLGNVGQQGETAAACGATVIYATGLGTEGYSGLPPLDQWQAHRANCIAYSKRAKDLGIKTIIGYLCATSIVGLDNFAANWTADQRAIFKTPPQTWLQQDVEGKPLPSWYGGEYRPACMNNPDWREYQHFMVRAQLESGHDGVFFDNPTVHPKGCYCPHCMKAFAAFMKDKNSPAADDSVESLRKFAQEHPKDFLQFRCTIARDFLADMRAYAKSINPDALVTANNSLNAPGVLFSQCRMYAYNIEEMSKAEDYVVVEDMATQPLTLSNGKTVEYGPTYAQLHAIIHGKPLVAVTIADADYHTPPNLVCLAMAEAAAHNASYMLWPTWPEEKRPAMIAAVQPYAKWLKAQSPVLRNSVPRTDVILVLPFRQWIEGDKCAASSLAAELTAANVQYQVLNVDMAGASNRKVLLMESEKILNNLEAQEVKSFETKGGKVIVANTPDWLERIKQAIAPPLLEIEGPPSVRGVILDGPGCTLVFLYNLNIERLSSYEDRVTPADNIKVKARVRFRSVKEVNVLTPDEGIFSGSMEYKSEEEKQGTCINFTVPRLQIAALVRIQEAR